VAFVHGRNTVIKLNGINLSAFVNTSDLGRNSDSHDVTTYGKNAHVFAGGLLNGNATMAGIYDNTAAGPRDVIRPLVGTVVPLIRQPEGTGAGKPQDLVNVLVLDYVETNPVADMVTWACSMQLSDDINAADQ
jgi:hypothetical protein